MPDYRASSFFRAVSLFAVLTFWGLAGIGLAAWRLEGFQAGLLAAIPLAGVGLYWLFALAAAPHTVHFSPDRLSIQRWLGDTTILYADIRGVRESYPLITIQTQTGDVALHKLNANDDALLLRALETHVPALSEARARRLRKSFPIEIQSGLFAPLFSTASGSVLIGVGAGLGRYGLAGAGGYPAEDWQFALLFGLGIASLGVFLLASVIGGYAKQTIFTAAQMTRVYLLRTSQQEMTGLTRIEIGHQIRTYRNIPRRIYTLTFHFEDREPFTWIPDEFAAGFTSIDAAAQNRVNDLAEMLRYAYLSKPGSG